MGCCTSRSARADRPRFHRGAHARLRGGRARVATYWPDRVERITGVPAAASSRPRICSAAAPNAITLTARGPEQQRKAWTTRCRSSTSRSPRARRANRSVASAPDRAGQRPGRSRAWPEGRSAAGLSQADRARGSRAHRRVLGRGRGCAARARAPALELFDRWVAVGVRALMVMGSNRWCPRRTALRDRAADTARGRRPVPVRDGRARGRGAAGDAVGRGGGHDDEPGGSRDLPAAGSSPPPDVRTDLEILKLGGGRSARRTFLDGRPRRRSTSCAARARGQGRLRGLSTRASSRSRACSGRVRGDDHPGTPGLFVERFATQDGRARFHAGRPPRSCRGRRRAVPILPHDRTRARAIPVRHPDATGRVAARGGARAVGRASIPTWPRASAHRRRRRVSAHSARNGAGARAPVAGDRPGHRILPVPLSGGATINDLTNPALDPTSRMPEFKTCAVAVEPMPARSTPPAGRPTERVRAPWLPARPKGLALDSNPTFLQGFVRHRRARAGQAGVDRPRRCATWYRTAR